LTSDFEQSLITWRMCENDSTHEGFVIVAEENGFMSDLSGRLGMASAGDALRTGRLSAAWRYLEVPGCA
jgi:hypothetical protein